MEKKKGNTIKIEECEFIGKSPTRVDARNKVIGKAIYIDDMKFPGMLYGKVLRSKYPHARILGIDTSKAEKLPGVKGVATGVDLLFPHGESLSDEPFLARDKVRYTGEGVAGVAATDEETAAKALALIKVDYEELPAIFDPVESTKPGAPLIHEDLENYVHASTVNPIRVTNVCSHFQLRKGDMEKSLAEIEKILSEHYGMSGTVLGRGYYFPQVSEKPVEYFSMLVAFWLLGDHGAEVEMDRKTGQVKILKIYAAHDTGKGIHPTNYIGQIYDITRSERSLT